MGIVKEGAEKKGKGRTSGERNMVRRRERKSGGKKEKKKKMKKPLVPNRKSSTDLTRYRCDRSQGELRLKNTVL